MDAIIPAQAGWQLAIVTKPDGTKLYTAYYSLAEATFHYTPIIAWSIREDGEVVIPITAVGPAPDNKPWTVRTPEGKYVFGEDGTCDNEHEALKLCLKAADEAAERRREAVLCNAPKKYGL